MKSSHLWLSVLLLGVLCVVSGFLPFQNKTGVEGAWKANNGTVQHVLLLQDGYASHSVYDLVNKKFVETHGGSFMANGAAITLTREFDTRQPASVGQVVTMPFTIKNNTLTLNTDGNMVTYTRIDDGAAPLAGTWKITGRKQGEEIVDIHQTGSRKTLKMLTGTRFQWFAINPATKEFFGTGGGTYTFENGRYTENIEFFSRDSTRVGASLGFDGKLVNGKWHHSGKSSRGDAIYEVWGRITK